MAPRIGTSKITATHNTRATSCIARWRRCRRAMRSSSSGTTNSRRSKNRLATCTDNRHSLQFVAVHKRIFRDARKVDSVEIHRVISIAGKIDPEGGASGKVIAGRLGIDPQASGGKQAQSLFTRENVLEHVSHR